MWNKLTRWADDMSVRLRYLSWFNVPVRFYFCSMSHLNSKLRSPPHQICHLCENFVIILWSYPFDNICPEDTLVQQEHISTLLVPSQQIASNLRSNK